jgi:hypothetical protein
MKRILLGVLIAAVLIGGGWFTWWCFGRSPSDQVMAAQVKFLHCIEKRDFDGMQAMLTDDYSDDYGHDRDSVIDSAKQVLAGFYTLTLKTEVIKLQAVPPSGVGGALGMVQMKIKAEGNGAGFSQIVLARANQITEPWFFHWHKKGRWPWDWKLVQIHNNQVP